MGRDGVERVAMNKEKQDVCVVDNPKVDESKKTRMNLIETIFITLLVLICAGSVIEKLNETRKEVMSKLSAALSTLDSIQSSLSSLRQQLVDADTPDAPAADAAPAASTEGQATSTDAGSPS